MSSSNPGALQKITSPALLRALVAAAVALTGLVTIAGILLAVLHIRHSRVVLADVRTTLLVGLSFVYLASLLRRGKRTAWLVTLILYLYLFARNLRHFDVDLNGGNYSLRFALLNIFLPVLVLAGLLINWRLFNVRSEMRNFTTALKRAVVILLVAFLYGTVGFQLLDKRDFHQDFQLLTGAHYTVDQFGLTTAKQLEPQTKRAQLFLDSLGAISLGSLFYVGVSFFSPIRFRLNNRQGDYEDMARLLRQYPSSSEDFFKLWPQDKAYFFSANRSAGLAYKSAAGVALVVGDPAGRKAEFGPLIKQFQEYCRVNDWEPAFIHTEPGNIPLYKSLGFDQQKIGEEAIVNIANFVKNVVANKDFRHIDNKFKRENYSVEILEPPHSPAVLRRLREVSNDWLKVPGRAERGFMLGYFSDVYIQQCRVMAARDEAGTIQAFINQVPSFNPAEANFDFLRHTQGSPGNINDYLMLNFIKYLDAQGTARLNMGLSPLAGLEADDEDRLPAGRQSSAIDAVLSFTYSNAGRFYSFKGLRRFKSKYEPAWEDRYIVYRGGLRGFSKTLNGLMRAMQLPRRHYFSKYKKV